MTFSGLSTKGLAVRLHLDFDGVLVLAVAFTGLPLMNFHYPFYILYQEARSYYQKGPDLIVLYSNQMIFIHGLVRFHKKYFFGEKHGTNHRIV